MPQRRCSVLSCLHINRKNDKDKRSMFQCPKDEQKARRWALLIPGLEVLTTNQVICEIHFESRFIKRFFEKNNNVPRSRLANDALPTIFAEYTLNYNEISSILSSEFIDNDMSNIYLDIETSNYSVTSLGANNISDCNINFNSQLKPYFDNNLISTNIGKIFPKPCEASLQDIVKDLSTSEQLLLNIKKEVLSCPESGVFRIKDEYSEDFSEKVKVEVNSGMSNSAVYESLQNNFSYFATLLPESWSMSQLPLDNNEVFVFSKECTVSENEGLMVMYEKNIVLNRNGEMLYSIHGKQLNVNHSQLPSVLKDIQSLIDIILKFNSVMVCQGICTNEFEVDKDSILYTDDLGYSRHVNCTLIVEKDQCNSCYDYSQYLLAVMKKNTAVLKNKTVFYCD